MRATLCLFLISLLISQSFCATTKSQDIQFLESIRRTTFGKTLLQSLQLTAKTHSSNAVESILVLLNQMLSDEQDAQAQADAAYEVESADCASKQAQLQADIDDANAQITQNNVNIDILNSGIAGSQASLSEANDKLVTSTNALQNLVDARAAEHSQFLQNIADISATITALKAGRDILSQLLAEAPVATGEVVPEEQNAIVDDTVATLDEPEVTYAPASEEGSSDEGASEVSEEGSFFQKKKKAHASVFAQFTSHMTRANLKKTTKFHGFVTALLTMLSRGDIVADQGLVNQILNLIDQLVDQLSSELTTLAAAENDAQNIFETQQTYLTSDITNLNSQIADLQADITNKQAQVADLQAENSNLSVTISNKSNELADSQTACSDYQAAYEAQSEERASAEDILSQAINIFQTRFDNVQDYINDSAF